MRMPYNDRDGVLYSGGGLRFGGFRTCDFLEVTSDLAEKEAGVRERIVAEAHYLRNWVDGFAEVGFFIGLLIFRSWWAACLAFLVAHTLEVARFWTFGASPLLSNVCRVWTWVKVPLFAALAVFLWREHQVLAYVIGGFVVIQGFFSVLSTVFGAPIRMLAQRIMYLRRGPPWNNYEVMVLSAVLWRFGVAFPTKDGRAGRRPN
jgi:hypothetical protein